MRLVTLTWRCDHCGALSPSTTWASEPKAQEIADAREGWTDEGSFLATGHTHTTLCGSCRTLYEVLLDRQETERTVFLTAASAVTRPVIGPLP